jgi:hypothetical protein
MATVTLTRVTKSATLIVERSWWTEAYLEDQLFLRLVGTKQTISHNDNNKNVTISIYKYYHRALAIKKWIPIAKPPPEFVVNMSDLTPKMLVELKSLDDSYTIVKLAVGRIFENIDFEQYHLSIASKLKVRVEK